MALVKATSEAIGLQQLAASWALEFSVGVFVDSSAALAVPSRKGNGKLRHVRIGHLWVQQLLDDEEVRYHKVSGAANPADLMTKHLPASKAAPLTQLVAQHYRAGHARCRIALV